MKITRFTKKECRLLGEAAVKALENLANEFGLKITYNGGTIDDYEFKMKLACKVLVTEKGESADKAEFEKWATLYGLKPEWYGKPVVLGGQAFTISGLRTSGRSAKPVKLTRVSDGKNNFVAPIRDIVRKLGTPADLRNFDGDSESIVLTSKDIGTLNLDDLNLD